jgi:hypothetical protein
MSCDSVRFGGKSGISIDNVIRVIANAKIASPKDITCSGFTFGVNTSVDIMYTENLCVVIAIIKIGSCESSHYPTCIQIGLMRNSKDYNKFEAGFEGRREGMWLDPDLVAPLILALSM